MLWNKNKVSEIYFQKTPQTLTFQILLNYFSVFIKIFFGVNIFPSDSRENKMKWLTLTYLCLIFLSLLACLLTCTYSYYFFFCRFGFTMTILQFGLNLLTFDACSLSIHLYFVAFYSYSHSWKGLWDQINDIQDQLDLDQHFYQKFKRYVFIGLFILITVRKIGYCEIIFDLLLRNLTKDL